MYFEKVGDSEEAGNITNCKRHHSKWRL